MVFPLALQWLNGCQEHSILLDEGRNHLNLLSVCHTLTFSSLKATFCFSPCLLKSRCVSRGRGDSKRSFLAIGFWDIRPSYWVETVTSVFESLDDGGNSCF